MRRIGLGAFLASLLLVPLLISAGNPFLQRIEALEAQQFIVVDANGEEVGRTIDFDRHRRVTVVLQEDGFPLFRVLIRNSDVSGQSGRLWFESSDCSGTPFIGADSFPFPPVFIEPDALMSMYIGDLSADPGTIIYASALDIDDGCVADERGLTITGVPAVKVFAWGDRFAPPFRVVTRGDLA